MVYFFASSKQEIFAVHSLYTIENEDIEKLEWLFDGSKCSQETLEGEYVGPRASMVSPWSTNAAEICQNMGVRGITRIERYLLANSKNEDFDPMLQQRFLKLDQSLFDLHHKPEPIIEIEDIASYNKQYGLALNEEEIAYLEGLSTRLGRFLTDSEVFGFSQVNSEHCRHKIFNGDFVIDGIKMPLSLFQLIKKTTQLHPNKVVSAYKDNVAFIQGPMVEQFAPEMGDIPSIYKKKEFESVFSLKAETHNFPTTVEPFNGAATGSGGEIRDRLAGGQGSLPLAGTAVYMTAYSRLEKDRPWEQAIPERKWLYQTPVNILIKASNGASDFGNKYGQPLIAGSVFTFEYQEGERFWGYDKVIMLAGGVGLGKKEQSSKLIPSPGDKVVVMGGDNYRIGMGGAAVSSADTGAYGTQLELNAIQRSNPEMQKRVANVLRALVERQENPIISIHDHGAGGHLNCLSELLEATGGTIEIERLPIGDPSLSDKEIIGNESQERMGLVVKVKDIPLLERIAKRERAPMYVVGTISGDQHFRFARSGSEKRPLDLALSDLFGSSPKMVLEDQTTSTNFEDLSYTASQFYDYLKQLLKLESVGCKDWLTNKVDRCVSGRVAKQQTVGPLQLPLNNCGVMALDYKGVEAVATSIGHSPISGLIDPEAGSQNSIAEALTNLVWAPLKEGLKSVSLSANWMWPCKSPGEDARLYEAVKACSDFALALGINIPTGKDSLSMKQRYPEGEVLSPGTVIISAAAHCHFLTGVVEPVLQKGKGSIYYLNLSFMKHSLGGSSFAQLLNKVGTQPPKIANVTSFAKAFDCIQSLIGQGRIQAGHDVGSGGLITTLLEMCMADIDLGADISFKNIDELDSIKLLFSENVGVVFQADPDVEYDFSLCDLYPVKIGEVTSDGVLNIHAHNESFSLEVPYWRKVWMETSRLLDSRQSGEANADERYRNMPLQPLKYRFPEQFTGKMPGFSRSDERPWAVVIREQGSNSEREMAYALDLAGFRVRDVHMTDLISGRETLDDVQLAVAVGGFSNSDVLGSAKGWAGSFKYNTKAKKALERYFKRTDTLSLGVCNGCQLFIELGLITPEHSSKPKMLHNKTGKFECVFTSVEITRNDSVMLSSLAGARLGIWAAHGEGKFSLPLEEKDYHIVGKYSYSALPANPNGSDYDTAMLCSEDGRHLVMMPHLERSTFPWNWAYYPKDRKDEVSPWMEAFVNARNWIINAGK